MDIVVKHLLAISSLLNRQESKVTRLKALPEIEDYFAVPDSFPGIAMLQSFDHHNFLMSPLIINHSPYEKGFVTVVENELQQYHEDYQLEPAIIMLREVGVLAVGHSARQCDFILDAFESMLERGKSDDFSPDIENKTLMEGLEKLAFDGSRHSLAGKNVIVTGGAQGFGKGIVSQFYERGANVVIADINQQVGESTIQELSAEEAHNQLYFIPINVADAASVEKLAAETVKQFGCIDVLISNAGVLKAGSLEDMDENSFAFVTDVNYKGYFVCTKYISAIMKAQHAFAPDRYMDIIQINSKSGLQGSNKNFAYAGGKFGGIGLTQSFALELVEFNIKVNAVCPGNYFEGPLWSDPEKGLFAQYLQADKVPGARNIEDVKKFYESKVPMKRGCYPEDVMKAILYIMDQQYETGQAVPVTGGQVMMN